jgi:hypothetical protein
VRDDVTTAFLDDAGHSQQAQPDALPRAFAVENGLKKCPPAFPASFRMSPE